ncbi:MAG TPA: hypothetical protein VMS17_31400 [Gemmataceae bacterium]|nr:hypothetical protein [Gemmataceae bacterium]
MRTILISAVVAGLAALLTASQAHAYGAVTRSATYTNPYTGRTATAHETTAAGPNGVYHEGNVSGSGPNGAYEAGGARAYSPTMYGGYSAGGVSGDAYHAGVVRYP